MLSVKKVLIGLAMALACYQVLLGLIWTGDVVLPLVMFTNAALFLTTTVLCLLVPSVRRSDAQASKLARGLREDALLPRWVCVLALATAALVPSVTALAVAAEDRDAGFGTWYIGGLGAMMTIVMVRRRTVTAWVGTAILAVGASAWIGIVDAFNLGVLGAIVWVAVAHLVRHSMDRAARDTAKLAELQQAASAWQATQLVRQRERRVRVQVALAVAGPVLTQVVAQGGALADDERTEARIAEGRLRDELRGANLLDDDVRAAITMARRRGATVTVFDEGGVDGVEGAALDTIRAELAAALRGAVSERLIIRTSPHDRVAVTVVGRSAGVAGLSDEDSVDLWLEIAHPHTRTHCTES